MSSTVELVIGAGALAIATVFVLALRFVNRRAALAMPTATVVDGAPRWLAGQGRARMARRAETFQRVAIAFGLTSVVVMFACMIGMIVLAIVAQV